MKWIKFSDRIPKIQEIILLSNGKEMFKGWAWIDEKGNTFLEYHNPEIENFLPIYWKPFEKSDINDDFLNNTAIPEKPYD